MIENKFKFYSPFHMNYKLKWVYLTIFISFSPALYVSPLKMIPLYTMFLIVKIIDWFNIMSDIRDSKRYIDWIDDLEKFQYIIYTKYLYYVSVVSMIIYEFTKIFSSETEYLSIILSVLFIILLLYITSDFYKNVLKLKK